MTRLAGCTLLGTCTLGSVPSKKVLLCRHETCPCEDPTLIAGGSLEALMGLWELKHLH
jgi:hypothetical protein